MSFFKGKKEMDEEFKEKLRMIEETKREIEEKIRKVHGKVPDVFGIGESIGYLAYKLEKERGNLDTKDLREMFVRGWCQRKIPRAPLNTEGHRSP